MIDHETSVSGWLDHARNAANRFQWKQRIPPRNFDQKRDEALLSSLMIIPYLQHPESVARQSINEAMELTIPNDPVWELEREQLLLLENDLIALESGPAAALEQLDATVEFPSRRFHEHRAAILQELGRSDEADLDRQKADQFPMRKTLSRFHAGIDHLRRQKFQWALDDFDSVLMTEPEHFSARLFEAICFLNLNRPKEAKVALTACIAQCPQFEWNRYFRGVASIALDDPTTATSDFHHALEGRCSETERFVVLMELGRILLIQGNQDGAKATFLKATSILPNQPSGWLYLTWVQVIQSFPTRSSGKCELPVQYLNAELR
jgi:tetratricopeptide (TPR) repeat protein